MSLIGKAETEYDQYEFGEGVTVVGCDGWDISDPKDLIRVVYAVFDDDKPGRNSHKLSFHVRFSDAGVDEVYALSVDTGNEIGQRGMHHVAA